MSFSRYWSAIGDVGKSRVSGGYNRQPGSSADLELREWFTTVSNALGMSVETDRVGNQWAWVGENKPEIGSRSALVLGSHLDSVPDGGPFDGALGVASAFAAVAQLQERNELPERPIGVVSFIEEEGSRFGVSCLGSRVLTGSLAPERALALKDRDGVTLAEVLPILGVDGAHFGSDSSRVDRIGTYLELHVEQGRGLVELGRPVAVGSGIRAYGRWRFELEGEGNHAGTTRMHDRRDPMLSLASLISAANVDAVAAECVATIGKVEIRPNVANAIPSAVLAWLDARGSTAESVNELARHLGRTAGVEPTEEFFTPQELFDGALASRLAGALDNAPILQSGAGHDAGILSAAGIPSAMLFVRNPTGVSHAPGEWAEDEDCLEGVDALARAVIELGSD